MALTQVTNDILAAGAAVANLGFTPANSSDGFVMPSINEYNATTTLTASDFGRLVTSNTGTATTLTLPSVSGNAGKIISISNLNTGIVTVQRAGTAAIFGYGQNAATSIILTNGQTCQLMTDGANWKAITNGAAGKILQVVANYPSTGAVYSQSVSSYTEISTAYRTSITPLSTNSILILEWVGLIGGNNTAAISTMKFYDVTNNAEVGLSGLSLGSRGIGHGSFRQVESDSNDRDNIILRAVVSNSSTASRTYSIYHYSESAATKYFNATATDNNGCSYCKWHFMITEVAA